MVMHNFYQAWELFRPGNDIIETLKYLEKYVKWAELVFTTADITVEEKKQVKYRLWGGYD